MFLASTLVALALAAGPEAAISASTTEAKPSAEAKAKPKKACYASTVSGSRLSRKTCVAVVPGKGAKDAAAPEAEAAKEQPPAQPKPGA